MRSVRWSLLAATVNATRPPYWSWNSTDAGSTDSGSIDSLKCTTGCTAGERLLLPFAGQMPVTVGGVVSAAVRNATDHGAASALPATSCTPVVSDSVQSRAPGRSASGCTASCAPLHVHAHANDWPNESRSRTVAAVRLCGASGSD